MSAGPDADRPLFANILFAGPCNRACPFCIGELMPERVNVDNLDVFPPRGIERLVAEIVRQGVDQVVFTGTVTDPQLYRHEAELLAWLRERLPPATRYSVHTNGVLALAKLATFNMYDRACLSFPSFEPATYERMMGSRRVPDVEAILSRAAIPVKISCVVTDDNAAEIPSFLRRCREIGVRRLVLRKPYGDPADRVDLSSLPVTGSFRGCPVRDLDGMEVTYWDFDEARMSSLNLFADGTLGTSYLLTRTPELRQVADQRWMS